MPAARPGCARSRAPEIIKVMAAHLRKCCSEDDLPTVPWRFLLSFTPFLVLLYSFSKVQISPKVTIACHGFCLLRHTKTWLACDIISVFVHILYYIVNFEIVALDKYLLCFSSIICYHTVITQLLCYVSVLLTSACKQA